MPGNSSVDSYWIPAFAGMTFVSHASLVIPAQAGIQDKARPA